MGLRHFLHHEKPRHADIHSMKLRYDKCSTPLISSSIARFQQGYQRTPFNSIAWPKRPRYPREFQHSREQINELSWVVDNNRRISLSPWIINHQRHGHTCIVWSHFKCLSMFHLHVTMITRNNENGVVWQSSVFNCLNVSANHGIELSYSSVIDSPNVAFPIVIFHGFSLGVTWYTSLDHRWM